MEVGLCVRARLRAVQLSSDAAQTLWFRSVYFWIFHWIISFFAQVFFSAISMSSVRKGRRIDARATVTSWRSQAWKASVRQPKNYRMLISMILKWKKTVVIESWTFWQHSLRYCKLLCAKSANQMSYLAKLESEAWVSSLWFLAKIATKSIFLAVLLLTKDTILIAELCLPCDC